MLASFGYINVGATVPQFCRRHVLSSETDQGGLSSYTRHLKKDFSNAPNEDDLCTVCNKTCTSASLWLLDASLKDLPLMLLNAHGRAAGRGVDDLNLQQQNLERSRIRRSPYDTQQNMYLTALYSSPASPLHREMSPKHPHPSRVTSSAESFVWGKMEESEGTSHRRQPQSTIHSEPVKACDDPFFAACNKKPPRPSRGIFLSNYCCPVLGGSEAQIPNAQAPRLNMLTNSRMTDLGQRHLERSKDGDHQPTVCNKRI
ncbi:uncharacterized protein LY89DRAFT_186705 [Mollisia scopiformis]|uniref:Uncharacterized protein n=1 Tax=Mollisia scopiformis TaxID=149040 RepID=A0A194XTF1_MOLSC|nr:uncharacterized protein LY89DRAFT_186705 [Mollisia scopiformis]KUJ23595.1 hypothetical protein LY89DRAFT_186705 [Mollisia scopiformis]